MITIVTGTDTGVGKTIVTAALAVRAVAAGRTVAVVKPAQTGTATFVSGVAAPAPGAGAPASGETSDAETIERLAGVPVYTLAGYPDPLAPLAAAEVSGLPALAMATVVDTVRRLATEHDVVLVEGAGGLLVPMGESGWTVADLAVALRAPAIVVARAGLGTLNHTALTLEALDRRGVPATVVIGSWPAEPELVHERNLMDIAGTVVGRVPERAGELPVSAFRAAAGSWFVDSA